jgi:serine/threonine-protein kinase
LNHPNIVTIYEIGQVRETHFMATEYLDGSSLRGYLSTTRITAAEALDIAVQVSSALAAAHARGSSIATST